MIATLPSDERPAVRCDGVGFAYGRVTALRDVSFSLERGELAYVVGPSASGKTTLLRLLHAQMRPARGGLTVDGVELRRPRRSAVRRLRRRVGVVFQDYRLLERLTAVENIAYALRVADLGLPPREAVLRAAAALRSVGLGGRTQAYPGELSGGQQQRLAIARALAARPALLLADEPTASLDGANAGNVMELLRKIAGKGTTVLVATHDSGQVDGSAGRVLELRRGELVADRQAVARLRPAR